MIISVDVREIVRMKPLSMANFDTYLLRNLMDNNQRYVMIERGKEEPRVIFSLPHLKKAES